MSLLAVTFELSSSKNCFLSTRHRRKKHEPSGAQLQIYEAELKTCSAFFSLSGDAATIRSGDSVSLNGLYAEKLGIRDNQEVVVKPVSKPAVGAQQVDVKPLSVDDWEILESSAAQLESGLLDQIRVVWPGQVIPVWVERSICIFITIASVRPCEAYAVLNPNTTVIVAPKVRVQNSDSYTRPPALKMPHRQNAQDLTGNTPPSVGKSTPIRGPNLYPDPLKSPSLQPSNASSKKVYRKSEPNRTRNKRNSRSDPSLSGEVKVKGRPLNRRHTDKAMRSMLMELVSTFWGNNQEPADTTGEASDDDDTDFLKAESAALPSDNLVYRIQHSDLAATYDSLHTALERQAYEDEVDGNDHRAPAELLQPTTIYVSCRDSAGYRLGGAESESAPSVYMARLCKLPSAQDREKALAESRKSKEKEKGREGSPPSDDTPHCVVRVVVVDRTTALTSPPWQEAGLAVVGYHGLAQGHAVVPTELRRQLKLDVTGSVWVKAGRVTFKPLGAAILYPISIVPRAVDDKMLASAFKTWVSLVADDDHPLVLFHGMLLRFRVNAATWVEVQLLLGSGQGSCSLISGSRVATATILVQRGTREDQPVPGVLQPLMAFRRVDDFDPKTPTERLEQLGGVSGLTEAALRHLEACLGSRPLPRQLFRDRPGLNHGMLLLTGPKGSGKTALAGALCHALSKSPTLAFTFTVDCKPLRGKRIESLQSLLEAAFDEAAWREPAVLLLDDLDVIAPATDNPGAEMSGEALYAAKVSEVLEGLIKFEMRNFTRLALIITSQSRSSLHPSIVASRGLHFVQEITTIKPPDKVGRKELLRSILLSHSTVLARTTLERLDLDLVAGRTEGYVARDLQTLVNRALHCRLAVTPINDLQTVTLHQEDFDTALEGFRPLAIRNVSLHAAGDLGWSDVGGLDAVKAVLVETLQWPSKYPQLFAHCPLRLRSGLLLYGPPGTGKTLLAAAVAREFSLNFISIKGPELLSKYIGASEQAVRDLFIRAQSAKPCILFFDEFDSIAPKRGHDSTGVTDRVVNQLLTQLDGVEGLQGVYMLGATSRPDLIDPALLRPGRLDKCLFCNIPTKAERRAILEALTTKMCLCDSVDLQEVADLCEFFTGADFKALLYNAQLQAINDYRDAEQALGGVVRIKGSPTTCALVTKSPITINPKRSPASPPLPTHAGASVVPAVNVVQDGKIAAVATTPTPVSAPPAPASAPPLPGPGGDAPMALTECMQAGRAEGVRASPPSRLEVGSGSSSSSTGSQHKGQVTFFPRMGDAPAILTPEDEARFLNMVQAIHRRQGQTTPRSSLERRRASTVLVKPSVLVPVGQRHLLDAARSMRPSVSLTERLRYQAIYDNFVSGRQGDFHTGSQETGMRSTLA